MKKAERILVCAGCVALLAISWLVAVSAKSDTQRQSELLAQAEAYLQDEVYVRAVPLLEEAAGYAGDYTHQAEETLKKAYLALGGSYESRYADLLEVQMAREDATAELFREAGEYYLRNGAEEEGLSALRDGVQRTGDEALRDLYEANRYRYSMSDSAYEEITAVSEGGLQVKREGLWGLARASGGRIIPCMYDKVSSYTAGQVVVEKDGVISAVDTSNYRLALLHGEATDFGNFAEGLGSLLLSDGWHVANTALQVSAPAYEEVGTFSGGVAPAKQGGRWGVINSAGTWVIPAQYDGVIMDEVGRATAQGRVFVRQGDQVLMLELESAQPRGEPFQDARPFADGWAAVERDGRWGYVDADGQVMIDFQYEDARSFGQHLGAVKQDGKWGYVSLLGRMVIEPRFQEAREFYGGSAAVRQGENWWFITLAEQGMGALS